MRAVRVGSKTPVSGSGGYSGVHCACPHTMVAKTAQDLFQEVASKFQWGQKVTDWMTIDQGLGAKSLDDFTFSVSDTQGVEKDGQRDPRPHTSVP